MPRTGHRRSLSIAAVLAAVLAAPAAAQAATYTVKAGDGPCTAAGDLACGTLAEAATAASPGDIFNVAPGSYASADFTDANVTINGSTTAPGVAIVGTLTFSGNGATASVLDKVVIAPSTADPAVFATGTAGVAIRDSALIATAGPGVRIENGAANSITRSSIVSGAADNAAVLVQPGAAPTSLTLDSSLLSGGGGADGAGLKVRTGAVGLPINAGNATITARHITIGGTANGIVLDSSAAIGVATAVGSIAATVLDSIVLGASTTKKFNGLLLVPPNTATLSFTRTDQTSAAESLFVNPARRNFRLKAGSPAIDKGQITPGDSATDIDGQPRVVGPASDLGADEFVAPTPTSPPVANTPAATNDGSPPAVVITKPTAGQTIKLSTTKTKTITRNGKKIKKKTTTRLKKIAIAGTAKDPSGVKGVILTIEKTSTTVSKPSTSATASAAPTAAKKCKWFNAAKAIFVLRSCTKPVLLLARLAANGTWTYNANAAKFGAGKYRIIVIGGDNSGAIGNSAPKTDAIRSFTLKK